MGPYEGTAAGSGALRFPQSWCVARGGTLMFSPLPDRPPRGVVRRRLAALVTAVALLTAGVAAAAPADAAVLPGPFAYVADSGAGTVSVVDGGSTTVTSTVPVGGTPSGVAVSPDGSRAYVTQSAGNTVAVLSTATRAVTATVPVGASPYAVAVTPDGSQVYVTNPGDNTVSVIDAATGTVSATIGVGVRPLGVAVDPSGAQVYVTNDSDTNTLWVISTATHAVTATVPLPAHAYGVRSPRTARAPTSPWSTAAPSRWSTPPPAP